jgi:hypothetical protein
MQFQDVLKNNELLIIVIMFVILYLILHNNIPSFIITVYQNVLFKFLVLLLNIS